MQRLFLHIAYASAASFRQSPEPKTVRVRSEQAQKKKLTTSVRARMRGKENKNVTE